MFGINKNVWILSQDSEPIAYGTLKELMQMLLSIEDIGKADWRIKFMENNEPFTIEVTIFGTRINMTRINHVSKIKFDK